MISGLGIDLIEVDRVSEKMERAEGFKSMVFSLREIEYCEGKANKYEHFAARFAAKEAFYKALGAGWMNGTAFNEIEILNDKMGKPEITLSGETAGTLSTFGIHKIHVSLTHLKTFASAVVIIERDGNS